MKLNFINLPSEFIKGSERAAKKLGVSLTDGGAKVLVEKGDKIGVIKKGDSVTLYYKEKIHFFRAFGLLVESLSAGGDFEIEEKINFDTTGVMPDLSNHAPMSVSGLEKFMDNIAIMGINMMLLYIEDNYEIPSRKFFGYMRSRYTYDELKAIDDYGYDYGIEVIPCMQTLGHLEKYLVWPDSADVKETDRELNVDTDATYTFIEEMIRSSSAPFRSKRIHIGMDEVWGLGRGRHSIKKYGLRDQEELYLKHLEKVVEITDKLGLRPMIWNDFVFCLHSESGINKYDRETEIPEEIMARFPKNVQLVYWHYGEEVQGCDDHMIEKNLKFGNDVIYAGGLFMWTNPLPDNMLSYEAVEEGIAASKKHGLREVFTTLWCVGQKGCDCFTSLLHLQQFAEHTYRDNVTKEHLAKRFKACTGASYDAFMNMSQFGNILDGREYKNYNERFHGQKFMWQDVLCGKYDYMLLKEKMSGHYERMTAYYETLCNKDDEWFELYDRCRCIFDYLSTKTYIAENLYNAYHRGDKDFLARCENELFPTLLEKTDELHEAFRKMWFDTRKAFGWSQLDERFGGMKARITSAIKTLSMYRQNQTDKIEELEEPRLPLTESMWT